MSKLIVVLVLLGLLATIVYAGMVYTVAKSLEVRMAGFDPFSLASGALDVQVEISNPSSLPVVICIDSFRAKVLLAGETIARMASVEGVCIGPSDTEIMEVRVEPVAGGIAESIMSVLAKGEKPELVIRGYVEAPVTIFGLKLPVKVTIPFEKRIPITATIPAGQESGVPSDVISEAASKVKEVIRELEKIIASNQGGNNLTLAVKVVWLCNGSECTTAKPGDRVDAVIVLVGSARDVVVRVKQDRRLLPDKVVAEKRVPTVNGSAIVHVTFTAEDGVTVRGYFVEVEWPEGKYVMPDSYPPRLAVKQG
ncbi:hypothetical protein Pyrfu_1259 [Pyrolobus fumarii 1A]|uniref:Late embryogenesis abundant protein LEA-2 subgroup domain-containing protein n=1 Tax=Pyrolobus fumarii (strain DSM 11204 / 1A) TaxID=694429 RepID=G0EG93_PYRF1|nr:LEA type 2 family protein [Pyrolobus fumarii]AEM39118.1 hypothetical protein Pyrfu_1259 [Pyrolobus fumarii 1A]